MPTHLASLPLFASTEKPRGVVAFAVGCAYIWVMSNCNRCDGVEWVCEHPDATVRRILNG